MRLHQRAMRLRATRPGSEAHKHAATGLPKASAIRRRGGGTAATTWDGYDGQLPMPQHHSHASTPTTTDRILICAHWDSRPWADNDPDEANHHKPVLAANDGASGVAVMLEMAALLRQQAAQVRHRFRMLRCRGPGHTAMGRRPPHEMSRHYWCLGSQYWAEQPEPTAIRHATAYCSTWWAAAVPPSHGRLSMQYASPCQHGVALGRQLGYGSSSPQRRRLHHRRPPQREPDRPHPLHRHRALLTRWPQQFGPTWHTIKDTPRTSTPTCSRP